MSVYLLFLHTKSLVYVWGVLSLFAVLFPALLFELEDIVGASVAVSATGVACIAAFAVAAVVVAVTVTVSVTSATCGWACFSQWKGSKLVFGSTHDGFLEA